VVLHLLLFLREQGALEVDLLLELLPVGDG
jgi:hypothetical protein